MFAASQVPNKEVKLSVVYGAIEGQRAKLGIADWGITESTLEEVFLAVTGHESASGVVADVGAAEARVASAKAAAAEATSAKSAKGAGGGGGGGGGGSGYGGGGKKGKSSPRELEGTL